MILHTYRFSPHSKGDDTRDPQEVAKYRRNDPLLVHAKRLIEAERRKAHEICEETISRCFALAYDDPFPAPNDLAPVLRCLP